MSLHPLLQRLCGGDRRSVGESDRVAAEVLSAPELAGVLFQGLESEDEVLRMRCADALEKATAVAPALLAPYKSQLLHRLWRIGQQEVRWHVAPMLARLDLSPAEAAAVVDVLLGYTGDRSSIVRTMAMQALVDIALRRADLLPQVTRHIEELTVIGTPAMKARGRKLLRVLSRARRA